MQFFIAVLLVAICGSAMGGKTEWEADAKKCGEERNVKLDDIKDVFQGKIKEADITADQKCFFLCMAEKQRIIKDGAFQPQAFADNVAEYASKEHIAKVQAECNLKGANDCDTAYKVVSCIAKNRAN